MRANLPSRKQNYCLQGFSCKHRAGASAPQWRRMAFRLLDEDKKAASSRHIGPAVA